jgi:hypothetical protein
MNMLYGISQFWNHNPFVLFSAYPALNNSKKENPVSPPYSSEFLTGIKWYIPCQSLHPMMAIVPTVTLYINLNSNKDNFVFL